MRIRLSLLPFLAVGFSLVALNIKKKNSNSLIRCLSRMSILNHSSNLLREKLANHFPRDVVAGFFFVVAILYGF